jgi:hypothetical protein
METEQVPAPEQAPLHPAKVDPELGVAVRVTEVPPLKFAVHVLGQLIPAGALLTVPVPVPATVTISGKAVEETLKVAVTDLAAVMETEQAPTPEQAPLHPAKVDPEPGVAVRMTDVPLTKFAVQALGQAMPPGALVTEPEPDPVSVTAKGKLVTLGTLRLAVSRAKSVQVPVQLVRLNSTEVMLGPVWSRTPM